MKDKGKGQALICPSPSNVGYWRCVEGDGTGTTEPVIQMAHMTCIFFPLEAKTEAHGKGSL